MPKKLVATRAPASAEPTPVAAVGRAPPEHACVLPVAKNTPSGPMASHAMMEAPRHKRKENTEGKIVAAHRVAQVFARFTELGCAAAFSRSRHTRIIVNSADTAASSPPRQNRATPVGPSTAALAVSVHTSAWRIEDGVGQLKYDDPAGPLPEAMSEYMTMELGALTMDCGGPLLLPLTVTDTRLKEEA